MALEAGTPMREIKVDTVFVGSCTNGRIEDLRLAAEIIKGRTVAKDTRLLVVPGSVRVRLQAEDEGLDVVFKEAGAEWRGAGCSMCLGMNPDQLSPGERSASTSNRNFEGRQGKGGRTHLVSLLVAAATAVRGTLARPPTCRPVSSSTDGGLSHGQVHHAHRHRRAAAAQQRRHRPDHPGGLPQAGHPHRLRGRPFAAWRKDPEFVLNRPEYAGATVLVAGPDFGTGSSREHAVWALKDYGFKAVISSRFADIFRGNSGKAGLVAAQVDQKVVERLWDLIETTRSTVTVDLEARTVQAARVLTRSTLRHRRLHPLAAARRARRHRHHALARGRHRGLRGDPAVLETRDALLICMAFPRL